MKKFLVITIVMFSYIQVWAQRSKDGVVIEHIDNRYPNENNFVFSIKNEGKQSAYIQFALEKRSNGRWGEILDDIFRKKDEKNFKRTNILILKAGEKKKITWKPGLTPLKKSELKGYFRLKLLYDHATNNLELFLTSKEFCF